MNEYDHLILKEVKLKRDPAVENNKRKSADEEESCKEIDQKRKKLKMNDPNDEFENSGMNDQIQEVKLELKGLEEDLENIERNFLNEFQELYTHLAWEVGILVEMRAVKNKVNNKIRTPCVQMVVLEDKI